MVDDKPPAYSFKGEEVDPEQMATIEAEIDRLSAELRKLSLDMHDHPEIGWKEHRTHDILTDFVEKHGFKVTRHAYDLPTAWQATFEHKGKDYESLGGRLPVVGFQSEEDALPGIGHACGHNLIAIGGIGASLAVAAALKKHGVSGKVILLGTPAEEMDGGKINLLKAGAYKPMDTCLMLHPTPRDAWLQMMAVSTFEVEYFGHNAHAALAPWEGVNALDAAVSAYQNIAVLRQQIHPTARVHGIIQGSEEWVENVIPGHSKLVFGMRTPLIDNLDELKARVKKCFEAAELSSGCKMTIKTTMTYYDVRQSPPLQNAFTRYMADRQDIEFASGKGDPPLGSTDFGNVSYELPGIHVNYRIPVKPGEGNHTPGFASAAATEEAHHLTLKSTKGIAVIGWKTLVDEAFRQECKREFEKNRQEREEAASSRARISA